ncbi:hypothetical protein Lal_00035288 [Lupinus albus]|uniref:Putative Gnk2-like domain-containing protein n=1 Tax=Lupinus albus TaxID=3870 RepID=A0A6A4NTC6_LUPAL|nr:putative Gnk2-like domain-containing protein [Lupinus albus]KAF1884219.1 hypothetical protein Lal_00035288 [Lupinus albus]
MLRSLKLHSTHRIILALILSSMLFPFSSILSVHGYPTRANIFIYAGCSQQKYQPNSPFETNLNSFLSSVISSSSQTIYNSIAIGNDSSASSEESLFGLYQCRGDLQPSDCAKCVGRLVNQIGLVCPYTLGAYLQLDGCYIRYEHFDDFLGKVDTSIRYKKCSNTASGDTEFFRRRDDVLADLESANGFRVSSSGLVQGFVQCFGDLTESDCSTCIVDVVGKLKSLCGSAAAVDVFLGQCYARYWASGYYHESGPSHDDQVGKSVTIIVGVFGGLAILVILLSICKKTMG